MAIDIKFTKFDNTPWGFRLAGGSDFPQPLAVIRVTEGSLADCMGLRIGDVVVRLNDQPVSSYTHGKAHEALQLAGNNFVLGVLRSEESERVVGAIEQENIVPYNIPLEELPPVYSPIVPKEVTPEPVLDLEEPEICQTPENSIDPDEEALMSKPTDANSEVVANKNITDEEIALLILEEEELLPEQGVLGVNFKKLRPRVPLLKESKVFAELQKIETAEPPQVQELKRFTTFLQKPERPPPLPKSEIEPPREDCYRVVIQKQPKKSVTERLAEKGLLGPLPSPKSQSQKTTPAQTPAPTPTPTPTPTVTPSATPEPPVCTSEEQLSRPESKNEDMAEASEEETQVTQFDEYVERETVETEDGMTCENEVTEVRIGGVKAVPTFDKEKIKELVSTELSLEKQLESVQSQLLALKQLPSEIETHLKIVSEQLYKIMELSGVQKNEHLNTCCFRAAEEQQEESSEKGNGGDDQKSGEDQSNDNEEHCDDEENAKFERNGEESSEEGEGKRREDQTTDDEQTSVAPSDAGDVPNIVQSESDTDMQEIEVQMVSKEERVKKIVVSYETQVMKSRDPSPSFSDGIFEPDLNLSPKDQIIQELQQKRGRKHSKDLWPQPKQVELTYGRRWRCPNDFFNDEMIAEVLSSQAEVIHGRALGINFKKYEKTNLPNYDHLMNSSAYKMIHKMEREPQKGIPVRPAKVIAAEDILERVKTPECSIADDQSIRSVDD